MWANWLSSSVFTTIFLMSSLINLTFCSCFQYHFPYELINQLFTFISLLFHPTMYRIILQYLCCNNVIWFPFFCRTGRIWMFDCLTAYDYISLLLSCVIKNFSLNLYIVWIFFHCGFVKPSKSRFCLLFYTSSQAS